MRSPRMAVLALLVVLLTSCTSAAGNKAGGVDDVVTLRLANTYSNLTYLPQVTSFIDAVEKVSRGGIQMEIHHEWGHFKPGMESAVVQDVGRGDVDLAWVGTRAFDLLGVSSFQALTAPMLVDSHALQAAILHSDLPGEMIEATDIDGVRPLTLLAGGLRKPFSVDRPWTSKGDFRGKAFQAFDSELSAASIAALGAKPVVDSPGELDQGLADGTIDGFEKQLSTVAINGTERLAPYVAANVNLWPETLAVVINADRFDTLTATQQGWLRAAAAQASGGSVAALPDDSAQLAKLCKSGLRAGSATRPDLAELRASFAPIYQDLRADPLTSRALEEITRLKATLDDRQTAALGVPAGCTGKAPARPSPSPTSRPSGVGQSAEAIEGVYRWELTAADAEAAGIQEDMRYPWPHLFTMTLADGRWSHRVRDARQDAEYGGGPYAVRGNVLDLTWDDDGSTMSFPFVRDQDGNLILSPGSNRVDDVFVMTTHPWQRIG